MAIRLLIVEKDGAISELARKALAPAEWRVATEEDPRLALYGVSAVIPDLVVCAADLGTMSGLEFALAIRDIPQAAHLPVVLFGGEAAAEEGVFTLSETADPKAFCAALYDALAELSVAEEEMAEAIELEDVFDGVGDGSEEVGELDVDEGFLTLGDAEGGLELLEAIELPDDDGSLIMEAGELEGGLELVELLESDGVDHAADVAVADDEVAGETVEILETIETEEPAEGSAPDALEEFAFLHQEDSEATPKVAAEAEEETARETEVAPGVEDALETEAESEAAADLEVETAVLADLEVETAVLNQGSQTAQIEADGLKLSQDALEAVKSAVTGAVSRALSPERLSPLISAAVERVVWEVVPPLAEKLILEAIEKLKNPPEDV